MFIIQCRYNLGQGEFCNMFLTSADDGDTPELAGLVDNVANARKFADASEASKTIKARRAAYKEDGQRMDGVWSVETI